MKDTISAEAQQIKKFAEREPDFEHEGNRHFTVRCTIEVEVEVVHVGSEADARKVANSMEETYLSTWARYNGEIIEQEITVDEVEENYEDDI